jgi:16S rRNA (cytidine1402-2'-O)-methyltransferase
MVGTLYVVGAPAGAPGDLSRRAQRILGQVVLVVAEEVGPAQRLLAHYDIATPVAPLLGGSPLQALDTGDVALLNVGWEPGPSRQGRRLVRAAIEQGFPVAPIPGPALPLTALVVSGLPADSFVYLGQLPEHHADCRVLLSSLVSEPRTLLVAGSPDRLAANLADLTMLGDRRCVLVTASETGMEVVWRGALGQSLQQVGGDPMPGPCMLVIGGASEQAIRWGKERLLAEVRALLTQGLLAKEIGRRLATESGWPRREIYRLTLEITQSDHGKGSDSDAERERP